jgi:uncharacterized short protein YbdD (DUF466 family)
VKPLRAMHWYLRELTGESAYDRYREQHEHNHPACPPLSRRDFERWRTDSTTAGPGSRCC